MLVCHGRTIEPKLGRLSRWLSLALLSRKMLWWHFTHCVSALGVPWRGFIPEQSSSEDRECWNRGQLLNPPPPRAQSVTMTKLSLHCRVPTSNPSTFQPGQCCLGSTYQVSFVPDYFRQRTTGSSVVQLHPAPVAVLVLVPAWPRPAEAHQELSVT